MPGMMSSFLFLLPPCHLGHCRQKPFELGTRASNNMTLTLISVTGRGCGCQPFTHFPEGKPCSTSHFLPAATHNRESGKEGHGCQRSSALHDPSESQNPSPLLEMSHAGTHLCTDNEQHTARMSLILSTSGSLAMSILAIGSQS